MHSEGKDNAELIFRIATLFFEKREEVRKPRGKPTSVMTAIWQTLKKDHPDLTREQVYQYFAKALALKYVSLVPPVESRLAERIKQEFPKSRAQITVVQARGERYGEAVSVKAADLAMEFLKNYPSRGEAIGLGLGPGKATLDFARSLSERLEQAIGVPSLDLFAITAGCPAFQPELAPVSFFNLFPSNRVSRRIGLFAETLVAAKDFARVKQQPGVKEAFASKGDIRIVVTALGETADPHDLLRLFLEGAGQNVDAMGTVGNVQYRPFSAKGVVQEKKDDLRAVTLFELSELVELAKQRDRQVILIARECSRCRRTKAAALRLLLERPELMVFSHLVMDLPTAEALLAPRPSEGPSLPVTERPASRLETASKRSRATIES